MGTRLPARRRPHRPGRLVLRGPLHERPLHARDPDVRGLPAGDGVLPRGAGVHARAGRVALRAGAGRAVPDALPRPGHAGLARAGLRGLRRGAGRRAGADALRRHPVHRRRAQGLPLPPHGPAPGPRVAARLEARAAGGASSTSGPSRPGRRALRRALAAGLRLGAALGGLRPRVPRLRRPAPAGAPPRAALPVHVARHAPRGRDGGDARGQRGGGRVRHPGRRLVLRRERRAHDAVRRAARGGAAALRLAGDLGRQPADDRAGPRVSATSTATAACSPRCSPATARCAPARC